MIYIYRSDDPLQYENGSDGNGQTNYECEVCAKVFPSKKKFLEHHVSQFGQTFSCCRCGVSFKNSTDLCQHYEVHKNNTIVIEDDIEFDYSENVEAVMNIPNEQAVSDTSELLYILDDSQCVNEVVIEEDCTEIVERETTGIAKPENITIVQVEHGYMIPSVFKGQLECKKRNKKRDAESSITDRESDSDNETENLLIPTKVQPSTSRLYSSPSKQRIQPKRRHEVPDFSAANYIILNPNEEVDMPHYKCLRCEQLFINKFVFFRHIEKGKCYVNSCDVCSATFDKNSEFYEHYLVEHTDRAICNFCFRTFMYEKNVKEHMLRHLDQFRHRCEECSKGFYTVREYRNHYKNRHMGIRHKCSVCGRSFADEYYFKRHMATHAKANNVTTTFV